MSDAWRNDFRDGNGQLIDFRSPQAKADEAATGSHARIGGYMYYQDMVIKCWSWLQFERGYPKDEALEVAKDYWSFVNPDNWKNTPEDRTLWKEKYAKRKDIPHYTPN